MKILPGTSSIELGKKIAKDLNISLLELKFKYFNDGESYFNIIGAVKDQEIMVGKRNYCMKHLLEFLNDLRSEGKIKLEIKKNELFYLIPDSYSL